LAFVIPCWSCVSFVIGGLGRWAWERRDRAHADRFVIAIASGLIAGESIMGVGVALLNAAGWL
jgi:uncharacterized oligopeptide transporter (OPT) family protein